MKNKVLISVWDKTGIIELAEFLALNNYEIISTGGTARVLRENGIKVTDVSDITKQNEVMNGRVKTLHPNIFGGILVDRDKKSHIQDLSSMGSSEINIVVVNLYPFESEAVNKNLDFKKAIEFIDIGGPSILRAAAKNFKYVIPLCNPKQYNDFIKKYKSNDGFFSNETRLNYAREVFQLTANYDLMINNYFDKDKKNEFEDINLKLKSIQKLRYGENPHQKSKFYLQKNENLIWKQFSGKELSYNNYFDIESAINIVYEFVEISCSIIKHANPCGFGIGKNSLEAYENAVKTDPISFFGGIVAFNTKVNSLVAKEMSKSFLECIVAPSFSDEAINILKRKKNLRLISIDDKKYFNKLDNKIFRSVFNGVLIQEKDNFINDKSKFDIVTIKKPTKKQYYSLLLGWKLVKFVKSNAIVFNNDSRLLGVGAGQMSRIDSVKIAINKAQDNSSNLKGSTMSSDAFFPFPDCVELAAKYGVSGVIQPGGSINDQDVIDKANELNLFMVFTKERHFLH